MHLTEAAQDEDFKLPGEAKKSKEWTERERTRGGDDGEEEESDSEVSDEAIDDEGTTDHVSIYIFFFDAPFLILYFIIT